MWRWWILLCLFGLAAAARPARADSVPAKSQALLLLRILAYDHNLSNRVDNGSVTVVVVSKAGSSDSEGTADQVAAVIREIARSATLANNSIQVTRLSYSDKTFDSDIVRLRAAAVYIAPGLGDSIGTITATTQGRKRLSFTGVPDYVDAGVSVGFALDDGRPEILVNLPSSRREGADLDVALLRAAKIVKK